MRVKKVNRYYCDYCKKSGCAAGHMKKHEERCTMNPSRFCGVCSKLLEEEQPDLKVILAKFPKPEDVEATDDGGRIYGLTDVTDIIPLDKIRKWANNCPACILAAIRQAGFVSDQFAGFNYSEEMAKIWSDINEDNYLADQRSAMYG